MSPSKKIVPLVQLLSLLIIASCVEKTWTQSQDFFTFTLNDINGRTTSLEKYRGMVTLIVNVASECGFTHTHYKGLVRLQSQLAPTGKFSVLAFPCNQFGNQEPKEGHEIFKFAQEIYNVNFPMFEKTIVKGKEQSRIWKHLTDQVDDVPNWNFFKYLVDENGIVIKYWGPWSDIEEIYPEVKKAVDKADNAQGPPQNEEMTENEMRDLLGNNFMESPPPPRNLAGAAGPQVVGKNSGPNTSDDTNSPSHSGAAPPDRNAPASGPPGVMHSRRPTGSPGSIVHEDL